MQALPRFRSTTTRLVGPTGLPSTPRSTHGVIDRSRHHHFRPRRLRAWDLTPAARLAFHLFFLIPTGLPMGRNPRRRSNHRMVVRSFDRRKSTRRLASPWWGCGLSGLCHPPTLTSDFTPNAYSRLSTRNHQTGGCTRLPSSHLYHLPITHQLIGDTARRRCVVHLS